MPAPAPAPTPAPVPEPASGLTEKETKAAMAVKRKATLAAKKAAATASLSAKMGGLETAKTNPADSSPASTDELESKISEMRGKMREAVDSEEFESAASLKKQIGLMIYCYR